MKRVYCIRETNRTTYFRLDEIVAVVIGETMQGNKYGEVVLSKGMNLNLSQKEAEKIKDQWLQELKEQNSLTETD